MYNTLMVFSYLYQEQVVEFPWLAYMLDIFSYERHSDHFFAKLVLFYSQKDCRYSNARG